MISSTVGPESSFDYAGALPYETPTQSENNAEIEQIVAEIEQLHSSDRLQTYGFGTAYALEASVQTKRLISFLRSKKPIPANIRMLLTEILLAESFRASEPTLFVRYGSLVLNLWATGAAQRDLRSLSGLKTFANCKFEDFGKMVRNVVVLCDSVPQTTELCVRYPNRLCGLGGSAGEPPRLRGRKSLTPVEVALMLAKQFVPVFEFTDSVAEFINDEVLSYLGPSSHFPPQSCVLSALASLIPYADSRAQLHFVPLLLSLWDKIPIDMENRFLMPALSEFAVYNCLAGCEPQQIMSAKDLAVCVQSHLHSMQIPLISAQAASKSSRNKRGGGAGSLIIGGGGISGDGGGIAGAGFDAGGGIGALGASGIPTGTAAANGKTSQAGSDVYSFARLLVYNLRADDTTSLDLLESFTNAVYSFCHPSNVGLWTSLVLATLGEITTCFTRRLNLEKNNEIPSTPKSRITEEITRKFVDIVKHPVLMAVYSSSGIIFSQAVSIIRLLAYLSPDLIVNNLLSVAYPTLQHGLHQPQRLLASIACLEKLAVPLTSEPQYKMHLTTLLELSVPNLNANDVKRCFLTMSLFQTVSALCMFADNSDVNSQAFAQQYLPMCVHALEEGQPMPISLEDTEIVAKGTSAAFPTLVSLFMSHIYELLRTTSEPKLGSAASACVLRVLLACSPDIFSRLLNETVSELSNPQQQSYDAFAQVCGSFVRANSFVAFPILWKVLSNSIREEIIENQAGKNRVVMPRDASLVRYLSVLNMCLLTANAGLLVEVGEDLVDLLSMLRRETGLCVVYTVANTIHHAIVALTGYSVLLPSPDGSVNGSESFGKYSETIKKVKFNNMVWNTPSDTSMALAKRLLKEHVEISKDFINNSIDAASVSVQDGDAVSNALIFIRTATGAVAPLSNDPEVINIKTDIAMLLLSIYPKLSKDDVSDLKEVLFVVKVWLCDHIYERTARLDSHQVNLYLYEKRKFEIPGNRKRDLPPAIMARRAQVYHNQLLSLATQNRQCNDELSKKLIFDILLDSSFSMYPAVTRNAFSALYSPLKIFNDRELYLRVYDTVLEKTKKFLEEKEYEKAEGGFNLLKYRSLGLQTVGRFPKRLGSFLQLCIDGVAAERNQLIDLATHVFFYLLPDVFRVGISDNQSDAVFNEGNCWNYMHELIESLISEPLSSQHWRSALLRTSALLMISSYPQVELNAKLFQNLIEGVVVSHPDIRLTSVLTCLNVLQSIFSRGLVGFDIDHYRVSGKLEIAVTVKQSTNQELYENDLSSFIKRSPLPIVKPLKTQPRPTANLQKFAAQETEPKGGLWRVVSGENDSALPKLSEADKAVVNDALKHTSVEGFWKEFLHLRKIEPRNDEDKLNKAAALLIRDLFSLYSVGFGTKLEDVVQYLMSTADLEDKNWHRVAAEVTCGLIMASPIGSQEELSKLVDTILNDSVISAISSDNVSYWIASLGFAVPNIDYRRIAKLISRLEQISHPSTSSDGGGVKLSLRTLLHTEIMDAVGTRKNSLSSVDGSWSLWNHSFQTTRVTAVEEVVTAISTTLKWKPIKLTGLSEVPKRLHNDLSLDAKSSQLLKSLYMHNGEKSDITLLGLTLGLLNILGGGSWVDILVEDSFPLLLRLSAVRDDPEILELVTQVFLELAITEFNGTSLDKIVDLISVYVKSDQWHQRMRILLFTQSFFFNHLLTMSESQRRQLTFLTVEALSDKQAEVRELAADTLSGIVRCSPPKEQKDYVETLTTDMMKYIGKDTPLIPRHAAVLGLGAIIGAFPYASPPPLWIPVVLAAIASKAAGDSDIVGKGAKQVLSDFKKTRQDTWHIDQLVFSQEQLDDLDGVLWRNYFA